MTPHVTVLMSVFNSLPYLREAVDSVLAQTYDAFEFLIVDDASTDGSREVLYDYARRDARIRILENDVNQGLGYSLNRGLEAARTPWVARMDADDVALPERLSLQMQYLAAHPDVDVLGGAALDCDAESRPIGLRSYPETHEAICRLIWTNPFIHPTVLYRRTAILDVGSYDAGIRKRQDYDLWFRCMEGGLRLANLSDPLIKYRVTDDHYRRNDLRVAWDQVRIGWRGCRRVQAGPLAYVGVTTPLVRSLLPRRLNQFVHALLHKVDPRRRTVSHAET